MSHEMPLSTIVFQKPNGETGELNVHDTDAIHNEEGSVTSTNLAASAVHTEDIASQAVTSDKLADNAVQTANIENGAVTEDKLSQEFRDSISPTRYDLPSFPSGWSENIGTTAPGYRYAIKEGNRVTLFIRSLKSSSITNSEILCTVPEALRPKGKPITMLFPGATADSSSAFANLAIRENGELVISATSSNLRWLNGQATYYID